MLRRYEGDGLRLVEVNRDGFNAPSRDSGSIMVTPGNATFCFCDDLAFSEGEPEYRELKAMLEGGVAARPENVLIYATSNRRPPHAASDKGESVFPALMRTSCTLARRRKRRFP